MITGRGYVAVRVLRVAYAAITLLAIVLNLVQGADTAGFSNANFLR